MKQALRLALAAVATLPLAAQDRAFLIDSNLDQLHSVDLATGAATLIGSTASGGVLATPAGLTWRSDTQTLWTIDLSGGEVGTIDPTNGIFTTQFTAVPANGWQGLEWDPTTQVFYLLNQDFNLYKLDPATGLTTLVGATGAPLTTALEVDAAGTLYAIGFSNGILYTVDKLTGLATAGPATTPANMQGLSFDSIGRLYGANTGTDSLYLIDPTTGVTTLVGAHGSGVQFAKGFEVAPCSGVFSISGTGCADFSSTTVTMTSAGTPCVGQTVNIGATAGPSTAVYVLVLGASNVVWGSIPLPFPLNSFGNPGCNIYQSNDVIFGALAANTTLPLPLPTNQSLANLVVHFQAFAIDSRLPGLGLATSNLLSMRLGR
jgi:hypothetical protein